MYLGNYAGDISETYYYDKSGWKGTLHLASKEVEKGNTYVTYKGTVYKSCDGPCVIASSQEEQ